MDWTLILTVCGLIVSEVIPFVKRYFSDKHLQQAGGIIHLILICLYFSKCFTPHQAHVLETFLGIDIDQDGLIGSPTGSPDGYHRDQSPDGNPQSDR